MKRSGRLDHLAVDRKTGESSGFSYVRFPEEKAARRSGRVRLLACESAIESMVRHGDGVVVMAHDRVIAPPDRRAARRRFTNV